MATKRSLDGSAPSVHPGGRPPAPNPEHIAVLHDIVTERARASLQEIADELHRRCGVRVCDATIRRALRAQGIVRLKPVRRAYAAAAAKGPKRYGYTADSGRTIWLSVRIYCHQSKQKLMFSVFNRQVIAASIPAGRH